MTDHKRILKIVPPHVDPPPSSDRESTGRSLTPGTDSPDVVFIVDAEGTILYVNRALPGVAQDDVLGTAMADYVLPDHRVQVRSELERVFSSGASSGFEVLGLEAERSVAWYDCRIVPTKRGGRVVSATVIARDVTIRRRVEENLRKELDAAKLELSARVADLEDLRVAPIAPETATSGRDVLLSRFRDLLDLAGEAIFITDPKTGRIIDANETACRWVSINHEDLVTQAQSDLRLQFPLRVPEDYSDHITDTRDTERARLFQGQHRRADGSSFPVEVAITRHRFGDREYVLAIARDAKNRLQIEHALRESEDKYRALFELSRDAIYLSNRDGTIAEVNDACCQIFGFNRKEFTGFEARRLYIKGEDIRAFQKEVTRNGFVRDMDIQFRHKNGSMFRGLLTATLRHAGDRMVLGYQCVVRPVAEPTAHPVPWTRKSLEAAEARGKGTVLLVENDDPDRAEAKRVLELAGVRVLIAESLAEAVVICRSRANEVGAILLAATPRDIINDHAFADIRRLVPSARVVLLCHMDETMLTIVEHLAPAGLTGIVRKPFHPLGLIQQVRNALEASRHHPPQPTARVSRAVSVADAPQDLSEA